MGKERIFILDMRSKSYVHTSCKRRLEYLIWFFLNKRLCKLLLYALLYETFLVTNSLKSSFMKNSNSCMYRKSYINTTYMSINYLISQQCCDSENESWNMRVKNTVVIVIDTNYILKQVFLANLQS